MHRLDTDIANMTTESLNFWLIKFSEELCKADPSNVAKSMSKVRNADCSSRFLASSYLAFFSRLASKKLAKADESEDEEDEHAEELNKIREQNIQDLSNHFRIRSSTIRI